MPITRRIVIKDSSAFHLILTAEPDAAGMSEVVISGTLRAVEKSKSPVPVETYRAAFFKRNATATLFESLGMINGVRPQLNCNVCNTGDIHMNGMEGPYTLILIDGMPVMSSLASVYGLVGMPTGIIDHIEIVRGPAAAIYGSESMGGLINIITKSANKGPAVFAESQLSSWGEWNADIVHRFRRKNLNLLSGVNLFLYNNLRDGNSDGFSDVPLQNRLSIFEKVSLNRRNHLPAEIGIRYIYENRMGGQMNFNTDLRGSDSIYGESIYTHHAELIGKYQFPVLKNLNLQYSLTYHNQNSWYGNVPFMANQTVGFAQLLKSTENGKYGSLMYGTGYRYVRYDDNTVATAKASGLQNAPQVTSLPGALMQWEHSPSHRFDLLMGYRLDYHSLHRFIHSPRAAVKYNLSKNTLVRMNAGTGFRVVNLFTEDHAALTGDRKVIITEELKPERSTSVSANLNHKISRKHWYMLLDITAYHTLFSNKIIGDFLTDPNSILFSNLNGTAVSRGLSLNTDFNFSIPMTLSLGMNYANVFQTENEITTPQLFAPVWSGNFNVGYTVIPLKLKLNLSGQCNGPMRLPVLPGDFRPEYSPWFCLANMQASRKMKKGKEIYFGVKNIFNFLPKNPIMRPHDPFDKTANDPVTNPNGFTFDTSYNYAPLQGRRVYLGLRMDLF